MRGWRITTYKFRIQATSYLAQAVGTDRLSEAQFRQAVTQVLSGGDEQMMTIAEQWVQQGLTQGRQEGLDSERQLLVQLARKCFGATVTGPSQALLERIVELAVLEELGEVLLDCADGEAWLALLARRVGE